MRGVNPPLFLLLFCVASLPVYAGDEQEDESLDEIGETNRLIETVQVTATRTEQSILDVSEAVSVISVEEIDRKGPELLAEMLRGVPGAFFQQTTPGQGIPIIRGLKGSQVLHLVDGMRLNNAFFRNAPNQYLGLVDAYATERMEVVRGSTPALYGADAMGGVLQILTNEPDFDEQDWSAHGRIYGSYNSVDSGIIGRAEGATGKQGTVISGGISYQHHSDRTVGSGDKIVPSAYKVKAADIKWRQDLSANSELMLSAQYLKQPSTPRVDELVPGYGQDTPSSEQYEFMPNKREFLHARYRLSSDAAWFSQFEAHLGRQVITDDRLTQDYGAPEITREFNESQLDGLTLQFNTPWNSSESLGQELVWGFEYYADEISSSRLRTDTDSGASRPVSGRFPDKSTMDSAAVYASNHWQWEYLSLNAGVRYSWFDIYLPATDEVPVTRLKPNDLTADIHMSYELGSGLRLVSNIGRGFRPPNIFDLGTLGSRPGNRFNIPNAQLKPESVWSYDLGFKASTSHWQAEAYAWYSDYQDAISSRFTGDSTPEGRQIVRSDNLNDVKLYGIESGLRYLLGASIQIYTVINYTRGDEREPDGTEVPGDRIPPLNGRLGLVYEPADSLRFETYLDFASRQDRLSPRDVRDPRIDPSGTSGWGTINLLINWQASPNLELGLRLENLADKNYREHGSGIDAPGRNIGFWFNTSF